MPVETGDDCERSRSVVRADGANDLVELEVAGAGRALQDWDALHVWQVCCGQLHATRDGHGLERLPARDHGDFVVQSPDRSSPGLRLHQVVQAGD